MSIEDNEFNDDDEYAYEENEGISDTRFGYSINICGGFSVIKVTIFETYDKENPIIGLSMRTPIGFNIEPFYANLGIRTAKLYFQ